MASLWFRTYLATSFVTRIRTYSYYSRIFCRSASLSLRSKFIGKRCGRGHGVKYATRGWGACFWELWSMTQENNRLVILDVSNSVGLAQCNLSRTIRFDSSCSSHCVYSMAHVEPRPAGFDIFGLPEGDKNAVTQKYQCFKCNNLYPAQRYAPHLEKCLGFGGRTNSRSSSRRYGQFTRLAL